MTLNIGYALTLRASPPPLRRDKCGSSHATSALAGGCWRGASRRSVLARTAQRDDVDDNEGVRANQTNAGAAAVGGALADASSIARTSEAHSSPLSFQDGRRLPNLSCGSRDSTSCVNIRGIDDPCLDDSLDLKIFQYMVELVRSGTTEERAAEVISQWSGGGGVERVDLRKLRGYFMWTTLQQVARQHAMPAVLPLTLTCLSYWSLGLLPGTDEAILPPAVRGALVAANLLMLVHFASNSLRSTGRAVRVGRAALEFSDKAELVLLAMRDLAAGHGALIRAATARSSAGSGASGAAGSGSGASTTIAAAAVAAQRHSSRQLVLQAGTAVMSHVKRQAAAAAATTTTTTAPSATTPIPTRALSAATLAATAAVVQSPASPSGSLTAPIDGPSPSPSSSSSSSPSSSSSILSASASPWEVPPASCPPPPPSSPAATPLSSLDSYLVLRQAAALSGGFDAVSELGLAPEEAAAAAAMYARYGDSSRGGRIGDYELRRLLQESGLPPLSQDERRLVLLLHSNDKTGPGAATGAEAGSGFVAGRGRGKGWLTFAEWAAWWAATPDAK